jgi:hypothetical protein
MLVYSGQYYGLEFEVRGLGVLESGLDKDPYQEKFTFSSLLVFLLFKLNIPGLI